MKVVLLTKQDAASISAQHIAREVFGDLAIYSGRVGDPEPDLAASVLISFLSPWIVRKAVLDRCDLAINFHPGPVEYPGTGCYNFALYEGAAEYGAVCHHMLPKVDTGRIIREARFPVLDDDTVETLKLRTMHAMLSMFRDIISMVAADEPLPIADTHWTRRASTRSEMEALKVCTEDMDAAEIDRRVRATVCPGYPGPVLRRRDGSIEALPFPQDDCSGLQ